MSGRTLMGVAAAYMIGCVSIVVGRTLPELRAPAVPLATVDPYMSVWSFGDRLTDCWPTHWTGVPHAMAGMIRVDGKVLRFMGPEALCPQAAAQVECTVQPTQTLYRFEAGGVELRLVFTTPMLPDDLELLACPVTFLTCQVRSRDGKNHDVALYFDASAEWAVNKPDQEVTWDRLPEKTAGMQWLRFGSTAQPILAKAGDNVRIDWGYFHVGVPISPENATVVAPHDRARRDFVDEGRIPEGDDSGKPRPANRDWPVIAATMRLGTVGAAPVQRCLVLAYDDVDSVEYMHKPLKAWWHRRYDGFARMLAECVKSYDAIRRRCDAFDAELTADAKRVGGEKYARLTALAYRQAIAGGKVVIAPTGEPFFFTKECFSNGCMATVDVAYPASPIFALLSPTLLKGMLTPVFEYARSGAWPHPFAPHDLGRYPKANGQVYNATKLEGQMPVEECGNMILMAAATAKAEGKADYAARHYDMLSRWATYLKEKGLDPENQLCTDDFAGHLAHNANLSIKAINALGGYAMMCRMLGKTREADEYSKLAGEMAGKWATMAADGDHYRLAFDKPGTWSQKYNLVWDKLLGLNLFPAEVARKEVAFYLTRMNAYGLPLDNRKDYTKADWQVWSATLADSPADFERLIDPLYRFVHETPDRLPFTDWYDTKTAKCVGFRARPVIGGVFIKMLADSDLWAKWSRRKPQDP